MSGTLTVKGSAAKFRRIVQSKIRGGKSYAEAVKDTARKNPKLHALSLLEANKGKDPSVLNNIREKAGLKTKPVKRVRAVRRRG